jgi:MFS transporter, SHS family, sialic acid transporter
MPSSSSAPRSTYAALLAAFLGWLFDGFEMGLFPLTGRDALKELLGATATPQQLDGWFGVIMALFLVGAATGGVVFGWLGDRIGRVRAMSLSILTYAVFTGLCGIAGKAEHVALYRFIASLGMGGEWSLGVALLNEVWPGKSRVLVSGLIGAAANLGYMLGAVLSLFLYAVLGSVQTGLTSLGLSQETIGSLLNNNGWRFLMISGAVPALLVFFIRLFVKESEKWQEEKDRGATDFWATRDLLAVLVGCMAAIGIVWLWAPSAGKPWPYAVLSILTVLLLPVTLLGYLYPVWKYLSRSTQPTERRFIMNRMLLGAGLAGVALLGTWAAMQWAPKWAAELNKDPAAHAKDWTQLCTAGGATLASLFVVFIGDWLGRRVTYALMCVLTIAAALLFYQTNGAGFTNWFLFTAFLAGGVSASFYGFFALYLPELFPTKVRATGQGFSFNFGRVIAAVGSLQTATLTAAFGGDFAKAGSTLCFIYLVGLVLIYYAPETRGKPLPD